MTGGLSFRRHDILCVKVLSEMEKEEEEEEESDCTDSEGPAGSVS